MTDDVTNGSSGDGDAPGDLPAPETVPPAIERRSFLAGALGAVGALGALASSAALAQARVVGAAAAGATGAGATSSEAAGAAVAPSPAPQAPVAPDPTSVQGPPASLVGSRSPFETPERLLHPKLTSSRTPLQELHGTITPSDLHFERHHAGVPTIDPTSWTLLIHGMVERPMIFTLDDLKRMPSVSVVRFLECSGNFRNSSSEETTPQEIAGLTSQSEWTGVPLSVLFREVGVQPDARWFLAEGGDAAVLTRSIPVEKAFDDAMIAYAQNGEALRPENGYPARLFLPGWEGNANVKWLRRLELAEAPFMTREETSRYTDPLKGGRARQFSFVVDARSIITAPCHPGRIEPGFNEVRGIAWSGRGRIARVEVSFDEGRSWVEADLQEPVLDKAHVRFRLPWEWDGREVTVLSRATDETGYVQPTLAALHAERGPGTSYHLNPITGWRIRRDGTVVYRVEADR
jgi:sulfane dehydrogenase subunit SoxC